MTGISSPVMIYVLFLFSIAYGLYELGLYFIAFIISLLGIALPFLIEYFRYQTQLKTEYAITDKYVLFKFHNGFKFKIHSIPVEDIVKIHVTKEKDNIGTIAIVTNEKVDFVTYNGRTGKRRYHPTLEFIENFNSVTSLLNQLISQNKARKLVYKKPTVSGEKLKLTKLLFVVVVSFMSLYLTDFFILPSKLVSDQGVSKSRIYIESDKRSTVDLGGQYKTQKGYSFSTDAYFPEIGKGDLELQISPIFKIVNGVNNNNMDYSDRLSSSLNHLITRYAFLFVYCIVAGGFLTIYNKNIIDSELFMKAVLSSLGFLGLFYLVWKNHN